LLFQTTYYSPIFLACHRAVHQGESTALLALFYHTGDRFSKEDEEERKGRKGKMLLLFIC